ncbi:MAG: Methionyl-tRNA formyltransferase-like protein [Chitinophagaceae bacterium]|nr:MAG: Methionyl-tRNA formyltransferase-like protein [Chitinophagaceae bacterium]
MQHEDHFSREELEPYLERYHERVFCYELYHKLRMLMDSNTNANQQNLFVAENVFLQSEVIKQNIDHTIAMFFEIAELSKEFMPDFLLHTPGNFDNQLIVMEVKSTPRLSFGKLCADLLKIQEFINNYNYQQGIFLAVNQSALNKRRLLNSLAEWHTGNMNTQNRILLLFKNEPGDEIVEYNLDNLPEDVN